MLNLELNLVNHLKKKLLINPDKEQIKVIKIFDKTFKSYFSRNFFLQPFFKKNLGVYLHGKVGIGKSVIIESIYTILGAKEPEFYHFSELIRILQIKSNKNLSHLESKKIGKPLIIIDELQLDNITDAILFLEFLEKSQKKFLIFTSNKSPREVFRSVIHDEVSKKIKSFFYRNYVVIESKSKVDYRFSHKNGNHYFFENKKKNKINQNNLVKKIIGKRKLLPKKIFKDINFKIKTCENQKLIDCYFSKICGSNLGNKEFDFICKNYKFIIIREIPILNEEKKDLIYRFIKLVDMIYREKRFLSISSNKTLDKIFFAKTKKFEFKRTYSRLVEIGSKNYISKYLTLN